MNYIERLLAHVIFFIIFTLLFINVGFAFGMPLNLLSLPVSYLEYVLIVLGVKLIKKQTIKKFHIFLMLFFPLLFFIATFFFGRTFDASYDGQDYHSGAVIALANGWNPWYATTVPIHLPDAEAYVIGYPKSLWMIQASIYLLTHNLNSATVTNLFAIALASIFVFGALSRLGIRRGWALLFTGMLVLEINTMQQFFTYMSDGFSYEMSLIAIASFIIFVIENDKTVPLAVTLSSLILLAGIKFSNLAVVGILGIIFTIYIVKVLCKHNGLFYVIGLFTIIAAIILWVPYGTNYVHFGYPLYPSNTAFAKNDLVTQNIPLNVRDKNNVELLFYGIYSVAQQVGPPNSPNNIARLKIPFTTSLNELSVTTDFNGRVGSEGVLFSGLFTLSLIIYMVSIVKYKEFYKHKNTFLIVSLILTAIFVSALLIPTPNVLRYSSLLYVIPMLMLVLLISSQTYKNNGGIRIFSAVFAILIVLNIALKFIPTLYARDHEAKAETYLLTMMRSSHKTYPVHATAFYSSYILLDQYGVNYVKTNTLPCRSPQLLWIMFTTYACM